MNSTAHPPPATPSTQRPGARIRALVGRLALDGLVAVLRALGPVACSELGGLLARSIGPLLPVSAVAHRNLAQAFPGLDRRARRRIVRGVWDNLGRTVAELPHLARLSRTQTGPGWEIEGEPHLQAIRDTPPALFFSGHFGNWELMLPIAGRLGVPTAGIYRAASNRTVDRCLRRMRMRALPPGVPLFAKGAAGARGALAHLRSGGSLGLLVDQKMNDGIAVPFLGRNAMTAPAPAQMALRFGLPVIPVHVVRIGPCRFRMVCEAPLARPNTGNRAADVMALTLAMNRTLEGWIRSDPAGWLWLHRRWPKPVAAP